MISEARELLRRWLSAPELKVILVDADDTIWHDSRYFRIVETVLLTEVEREGGVRDVAIADLRDALKKHGAGEQGFIQAVLEVTATHCPRDRSAVASACEAFAQHPVEVLAGVSRTLEALHFLRRILLTKGIDAEQRRKLHASGLSNLFDEVVILEQKNTTALAGVLAQRGLAGSDVIAVGNSVRHDILPALANGARAVWLNHPENTFGRNEPLPEGACEVGDWATILDALPSRPAS